MQISLRKLTAESEDIHIFSDINDEAFPPSEYMSMEEILNFASATNTDVLGIYDGALPIGFIVILKNERCGYIYFYAIDGRLRSKGYGSAVLERLGDEYKGIQMTLDFELLDENADNYVQRLRRRQFYLRNGFHETGRYTMLGDERFEVVCNGGELDEEGLKDLLTIIHAHRPEFPNVLL